VAADPENEKRGHDADEKDPALGAGRQDERENADDDGAAEDADVDAGLEDGGHPRAPGFRPGFGEERGADGPFAADAEGGDERKIMSCHHVWAKAQSPVQTHR